MDYPTINIKKILKNRNSAVQKKNNDEIVYYPYSRRDWYYPPVSDSRQNGLISDWKDG